MASPSEGLTPKPPQGSNNSSASPFHSISDEATGTGGGGRGSGNNGTNGKGGASPASSELPPMPPRRGSRAPTPYAGPPGTESRAAAIFTSNIGGVGEETTGLRRRRGPGAASAPVGGGARGVSPERDSSSTGLGSRAGSTKSNPDDAAAAAANAAARGPSPAASLLGSLGRGVLGVSRLAIGAAAGSLGPPFAWAEFMFAWVADVTPPRLKRLAHIFWDAGSHITKLAYTPAGAELGFAARNVVDGIVETIAAPKGRAVVLESGMTFVKFAEAMDTPEMHAAITQAFKLGQRGLDMLATDQAKDLLANGADFLSRLARLANAPETTLAVAEFVTVVCHNLAQENAAYSRERVAQLSPFEAADSAGFEEEEEDLKKPGAGGKGVRIVREDSQTGERLEWDEDLVLGRKAQGSGVGVDGSKTSTEESETPREGEGVDEEELDVSMNEGPSGRVGEEGEGVGGPDLLPIQEGAMESSASGVFGAAGVGTGVSVAEHARWEREDKALLVKRLVEAVLEEKRRAAEAGGVYTASGGYKSERERAAHCALSFFFFISYTVFALIGLRATLTTLVAYGGGSK